LLEGAAVAGGSLASASAQCAAQVAGKPGTRTSHYVMHAKLHPRVEFVL
jgi:hypothetical protein